MVLVVQAPVHLVPKLVVTKHGLVTIICNTFAAVLNKLLPKHVLTNSKLLQFVL